MSYTNLDVAKVWRTGRDARSSNGNLWCSNFVLFSYSTPIAKLVNGKALITERHYSATTEGKHVNAAYKAMGYVDCYRVPYILADGGRALSCHDKRTGNRFADSDMHEANLIFLAGLVGAEKDRLKRARVYKSTDHLDRMTRQAEAYRDTFCPDIAARAKQAA